MLRMSRLKTGYWDYWPKAPIQWRIRGDHISLLTICAIVHIKRLMKAKTSKEELVSKSLDHIWSHGYHSTSIRDIVENAEILRGSFYNYFTSKDEFVSAVLRAYTDQWELIVSSHLEDRSKKPSARLYGLIDHYRNMYQGKMLSKGCLAGNICQELGGTHKGLSRQVEAAFMRVQNKYRACVEDAISMGELEKGTDVDEMASFLLNGLQGALMRMKTTGNNSPLSSFRSITSKFFARPN